MPPRKQKQKQRQSQKQSVVVNIHDKPKKRRARKKKAPSEPLPPPVVLGLPKVPPIVVQYTEPTSLVPPQPPAPRQEPARQPEIAAAPRAEPIMAAQRQENILQGVRREPERPVGQRARPEAREVAVVAAEQRRDIFRSQQPRPSSDILQPPSPVAFAELVAEGPRQSSQRAEEERQREIVFAEPVTPVTPPPLELIESRGGGGPVSTPKKVYTPSGYPRKDTIISFIMDNTSRYTLGDLATMKTYKLRRIYDGFGGKKL